MDFQPPPYPDDVPDDLGPYSRDEIIAARTCLLHTVQKENSSTWQGIKYKLGILPNGRRLRVHDPPHVWIPEPLPQVWSAPVSLYDPKAENTKREQVNKGRKATSREAKSLGQSPNSDKSESNNGSEKKTDGEKMRSPSSQSRASPSSSSSSGQKRKRKSEERLLLDTSEAAPGPSSSKLLKRNTAGGQRESGGRRENVGQREGDGHLGSVRHGSGEDRELGELPASSGDSCQEGESSLLLGKDGDSYAAMFQCDLCPFLVLQESKMKEHLKKKGHYSASKYLGSVDPKTEALNLKYLTKVCALRFPVNKWKMRVPVCPECHKTFVSVSRCMSHTLAAHNMTGVYSLRPVFDSKTFFMDKEIDQCLSCSERLSKDGLLDHISHTGHMHKYNGQKSEDKMVVFPCSFCHVVEYNYFAYKDHILKQHWTEVKDTDAVEVTCHALGKYSQSLSRTLPPQDPDTFVPVKSRGRKRKGHTPASSGEADEEGRKRKSKSARYKKRRMKRRHQH